MPEWPTGAGLSPSLGRKPSWVRIPLSPRCAPSDATGPPEGGHGAGAGLSSSRLLLEILVSYDQKIEAIHKDREKVVNALVAEFVARNDKIAQYRDLMSAEAKEKTMTIMRLRSLLGAQQIADALGITRTAVYALLDEARGLGPTLFQMECGHAVHPDMLNGNTTGDIANCPICGKAKIIGAPGVFERV